MGVIAARHCWRPALRYHRRTGSLPFVEQFVELVDDGLPASVAKANDFGDEHDGGKLDRA
jgi:hypothetical protein